MKKIIALTMVAFLFAGAAYAQKYAFVDTEYILKNIPSYVAAQDELDKLSEEWEAEIQKAREQIEEMYKAYKSERVLLTDEMRTKRENEIMEKEKEVNQLQQQYFGPEGKLFQKREELVKPIQDALYKTIKEMSVEGGYAIIFDTSAGASILYTNPRYDMSDEILERMGYK